MVTTIRLGEATRLSFRVLREAPPTEGERPQQATAPLLPTMESTADATVVDATVVDAAVVNTTPSAVTGATIALSSPPPIDVNLASSSRDHDLAALPMAPHLTPHCTPPTPLLASRGATSSCIVWQGFLFTYSSSQRVFRKVAEFGCSDLNAAHLPLHLELRFCARPGTGGFKKLILTAVTISEDRESVRQMRQLSAFLRDRALACHMRAAKSGRDIYVTSLLEPDASGPWRAECLLGPKQSTMRPHTKPS